VKRRDARYNPERQSSWIKIKNPAYTQIVEREKLFEKRKPLATLIQGRNPNLLNHSNFLTNFLEVLAHEERLRSFETERA
jgi:ATP-dependent DNA ligase